MFGYDETIFFNMQLKGLQCRCDAFFGEGTGRKEGAQNSYFNTKIQKCIRKCTEFSENTKMVVKFDELNTILVLVLQKLIHMAIEISHSKSVLQHMQTQAHCRFRFCGVDFNECAWAPPKLATPNSDFRRPMAVQKKLFKIVYWSRFSRRNCCETAYIDQLK